MAWAATSITLFEHPNLNQLEAAVHIARHGGEVSFDSTSSRARSYATAVQRFVAGEGPDRSDPNGAIAFLSVRLACDEY